MEAWWKMTNGVVSIRLAVISTKQLMNSAMAEVIAVFIAYSMIAVLIKYLPPRDFPLWYLLT